MNVVILVAVVAVCAFAMGYAFGAAPIQEELKEGLEPEKTERANFDQYMGMWNKEGEEHDEDAEP